MKFVKLGGASLEALMSRTRFPGTRSGMSKLNFAAFAGAKAMI